VLLASAIGGALVMGILRWRKWSLANAAMAGAGFGAVLGSIAAARDLGSIPTEVLILVAALGGSLSSMATERERRKATNSTSAG
jgi:hypothetical protein